MVLSVDTSIKENQNPISQNISKDVTELHMGNRSLEKQEYTEERVANNSDVNGILDEHFTHAMQRIGQKIRFFLESHNQDDQNGDSFKKAAEQAEQINKNRDNIKLQAKNKNAIILQSSSHHIDAGAKEEATIVSKETGNSDKVIHSLNIMDTKDLQQQSLSSVEGEILVNVLTWYAQELLSFMVQLSKDEATSRKEDNDSSYKSDSNPFSNLDENMIMKLLLKQKQFSSSHISMIQSFCNKRFEEVFTAGILGKQLSKVPIDNDTTDVNVFSNESSKNSDIDAVANTANIEIGAQTDSVDNKVSELNTGESVELNPKNIKRIIEKEEKTRNNLGQSMPASPTRSIRSVKSTRSIDSRSITGSIASISTISKFSTSNDSIYNTTAESAAYLIEQQWDMIESSLRSYQLELSTLLGGCSIMHSMGIIEMVLLKARETMKDIVYSFAGKYMSQLKLENLKRRKIEKAYRRTKTDLAIQSERLNKLREQGGGETAIRMVAKLKDENESLENNYSRIRDRLLASERRQNTLLQENAETKRKLHKVTKSLKELNKKQKSNVLKEPEVESEENIDTSTMLAKETEKNDAYAHEIEGLKSQVQAYEEETGKLKRKCKSYEDELKYIKQEYQKMSKTQKSQNMFITQEEEVSRAMAALANSTKLIKEASLSSSSTTVNISSNPTIGLSPNKKSRKRNDGKDTISHDGNDKDTDQRILEKNGNGDKETVAKREPATSCSTDVDILIRKAVEQERSKHKVIVSELSKEIEKLEKAQKSGISLASPTNKAPESILSASNTSSTKTSMNNRNFEKEREYEALTSSQVIGLIALSNILTFLCCFLYNLYSGLQSSSSNYRR